MVNTVNLREAGGPVLHWFLGPGVLALALLLTHAVTRDKILHLSYKDFGLALTF